MRESLVVDRTVKVIRTRFKIGAWLGISAEAVLCAMEKVPRAAKLMEIQEDGDESYLIFEEEKAAD